MQKLVVSLAIMFAMLVPATGFAQTQKELNQQVAQAIADKLSDKFPEYTVHVRYNSGVATLMGELYSPEQVNEAVVYVESLPGVTKVINSMKIVQQRTQIQAMPISPRLGGNVQAAAVNTAAQNNNNIAQTAATTEQSSPANAITQVSGVSGQMRGVTDFSQQARPATTPPTPAAANSSPVAPAVVAPVAPAPALTPAPTLTPAQTQAAVQVSYVESPQEQPTLAGTDFAAPIGNSMPSTPLSISTHDAVQYQGQPNFGNAPFNNTPMPMGHQTPTAGRYDQPNVPNYAWPSYAAPNNYSEVAYPRLYCPQAAPYIGPFYPYPQVPMGWRKVTLEWHDGYWWLDFDDGTAKGPFSPLFRQPNPKRY